ncbi:MAG: response regulator [Chloroflexota bacterium]
MVLVINDDPALLDVYEDLLTSMGHRPVTKATVASGSETVREVNAEALVVDLQQPDEDEYGIRIIEELRDDAEMIAFPIVLCTGASVFIEPTLRRLEQLNVPIVFKPFNITDLENALTTVLREAQTKL